MTGRSHEQKQQSPAETQGDVIRRRSSTTEINRVVPMDDGDEHQRTTTTTTTPITAGVAAVAAPPPDAVDWEEWDGSSPFWIHCLAGSMAGVMEHAMIYPLDTVRTHIQVCAACVHRQQALLVQQQHNDNKNYTASQRSLLTQQEHAATQLNAIKQKVAATIASTTTSSSAKRATTGVSATSNTTTTIINEQAIRLAAGAVSTSGGHHSLLPNGSIQQLPLGMWQTIRYLVLNSSTSTATTNGVLESTASLSTTSSLSATAAATNNISSTSTSPLTSWLPFNNSSNNSNATMNISRLWRGVQTILIGCIPAHALYFSTYEMVKACNLDADTGEITTTGSMLAGGTAVVSHDLILSPLDTMKQRLQLGHYNGSMRAAFVDMIQHEGWHSLYRSFPITLATNVPYGMVMVATNEFCKKQLSSSQQHHHQHQPLDTATILVSSSVAGLVASAITTPLDRIKTALQTQQLAPACQLGRQYCPKQQQLLQQQQQMGSNSSFALGSHNNTTTTIRPLPSVQNHHPSGVYANWRQAAAGIWATEGAHGFSRGMVPRVLSHTPAVAISWTTYETAKRYLLEHFYDPHQHP